MYLIFLSFFAGIMTLLAPCIIPFLPVILGGSMVGKNRKLKPLTICLSLTISIFLFTILLKTSTILLFIPEFFWKFISGGLIFLIGIFLFLPKTWQKVSLYFDKSFIRKSNEMVGTGFKKDSFKGDVLIGASLGPIFVSCSPVYFFILATIFPVNFSLGIILMFFYCLGLGLVLFMIAFFGERLTRRLLFLSNPDGWFKKFIGLLFITIGISIFFGFDKRLETFLVEKGLFSVSNLELRLLDRISK